MLDVINVRLQFGGRVLFEDVNLKFSNGNCYGVIGANGAGKSTFLRILSGDLEPNKGQVVIGKNERMSVLTQNQDEYNDCTVINTVLSGHKRLMEIINKKEELYSKGDQLTMEDGNMLGDLEAEFLELDGWSAESQAETLLSSLGVESKLYAQQMSKLDSKVKVKVLLAKALFKTPEILILDEPTNNLDARTVRWLENYLMEYENTVIVVSHNRHFLNKVCTHICDVDYGQIGIYMGNYDFWYESSQLMLRQMKDQNKKMEQRAEELKTFIARFSANASKSKQATSRKNELEKLSFNDIKPSNRKYPFIDFKSDREIGNDVLNVEGLTKKGYFSDINFMLNKGEKVAILCDNSNTVTMLFDVLNGLSQADSGKIAYGKTITSAYLPKNNDNFFNHCNLSLIDWLKQFSKDQMEITMRSWLGRMLFSGEEALKKAKVLSGGEKVRCMLSRCMLSGANFLTMDEPTNHLDLESITALNKGMENFKGCMIFTTSDEEILSTVANRIIEIKDGKKVFDKEINFEDYLTLMTEQEVAAR